MNSCKDRFILLWLYSAAIVTLARVLNAADLGYDLTVQIQAGQNLLQGNGLSTYALAGEDDLAKPAKLISLTQFPAGYSLFVAALMAMGFSVGGVVKAGGAAATILGWWGWANLAYSFFSEGLKRGRFWRGVGFAIAVSSPLLFTPPWQGTDIFLWAAIPWVLAWVVRASDKNSPHSRWFDWVAGAVCGLCVLMRYASAFLVVYAGFLILCQSYARVKVLTQRWAAFAAGVLPLLAFQVYLNHFVSTAGATPGGLTFKRGVGAAVERLWDGLWMFTSANLALVWWMPHKVVELLTQPGEQAPWLLGATFAVFFLLPPLFALKLGRRGLIAASSDVRIAAVGLFLVVPTFLWACMMFDKYPFLADFRYYIPLLPLAVFVAYALALAEQKRDSKIQAFVHTISLWYLTGYLCIAAVWIALLVLPFGSSSGKRAKFMGTSQFHHWPSMKVEYEFSAPRAYTLALLKDEPDTVLVTNQPNWFYADPSVDRSRIRRLGDIRATYISGPARILIVAEDPWPSPLQALYWFASDRKPQRSDYLEDLPDLRLVKRFQEENVKILETHVPAGGRITLKGTGQPLLK